MPSGYKLMKLRLMEDKGRKDTDLILTANKGKVEVEIGYRFKLNATKIQTTPSEARRIAISLLELADESERLVRKDLLLNSPVGSELKLVAVPVKRKGEKKND